MITVVFIFDFTLFGKLGSERKPGNLLGTMQAKVLTPGIYIISRGLNFWPNKVIGKIYEFR